MSSTSPRTPNRGCLGWPGDFIIGGTYPLRALVVLNRTRRLWGYVIIPIFVNLLVGALLYTGLLFAGFRAIDSLLMDLPQWAAVVEVLLRALLLVILFVGIGFILLRFGVVLGAPWYDQLSEQLEELRLGIRPASPPASAGAILRSVGDALLFEVKKLMLFLGIWLPLLLFYLVPGWGALVATGGSIVLAAFVLCLDMFDFSLARRGLRFRAKLGIVRRMMPASGGFGLVCVGLVTVPFLNLLAIPLCVTAGTLFFCDRIWPQLPAELRTVAAAEPPSPGSTAT